MSGDDWIRDLIAEDGEDPARISPAEVEAAKKRIEALLLEGIQSGPGEIMTPARWQAMRERIEARLKQQGK